ncbi:MAG: hypothetical protein OHK0039_34270 [Bacteroidia bacterium]
MKPYSFILLALLLTTTLIPAARAQSGTDEVKAVLEEGLRTHLSGIYPPKGCEDNGSLHDYAGAYKISQHSTVNGTLRLTGQAKVSYRNARTAGTGSVEFLAEFDKQGGQTVLTKLRWRKGGCMPLTTLYEAAD